MRPRIVSVLVLTASIFVAAACGGQTTPTPVGPAGEPASLTATAVPTPSPEPSPTAEPTPEPTSTPTPDPSPAFEESPCPMDLPPGAVEGDDITCGYVDVPEDRPAAVSKDIRLAVAVIHSTSDEPAPDPLFMLAGGPGESALTSFVQLIAAPGMERFWADRDVVLVEQRGTRYATPFLQCEEMAELRLDLLSQNLGDEAEESLKREAWAACRDRLEAAGANLGAYNSVENAADIIAVADLLGYDTINLYGGSYGSLLAQHVMRDYPERVRAVILDAVSPLRHEPNMLYKAHSTDRALRMLFEQCQADPACSEAYPDLEQVYFDLVEKLNETPAALQLQEPGGDTVLEMVLTGDRFVAQTRDLFYVTQLLPDLPGAIYDMAAGDFTLLEMIQSQFLFSLSLADGMYNSVICTELADFTVDDMADPAGLYPQVAAVAEDLIDEVMLQPCQVWGVDLRVAHLSKPVSGDIPTLLLSGEFDPTVPPAMADVAAEELTNAYAYTFLALGHTALGRSECATGLMLAFLDDPAQAPDATCVEELPVLTFRVPVPAGEIALEPYANDELGIGGVAPVGWTELRRGTIARGGSAVDQAVLVYDVAPISADEFLGLIVNQFGLGEPPDSSGEIAANGLTWALYQTEAQGYPIDFALAEQGALAYVILVVSEPDEREAMYEGVFIPAVEALAPQS